MCIYNIIIARNRFEADETSWMFVVSFQHGCKAMVVVLPAKS